MLVPSECLRNHYLVIGDFFERSIQLSLGNHNIYVSFSQVTNNFPFYPTHVNIQEKSNIMDFLFRFWAREWSNLLWKYLTFVCVCVCVHVCVWFCSHYLLKFCLYFIFSYLSFNLLLLNFLTPPFLLALLSDIFCLFMFWII